MSSPIMRNRRGMSMGGEERREGGKGNETDLRGVMVGSRVSQRAGVAAEQGPRKRRKVIHLSPLYPFSLRRKFHTKDMNTFQ